MLDRLSPAQRDLLAAWLPGAVPVADHSWGLVDSEVLELRHGAERHVVKASGAGNHHLVREIRAHRQWLAPLAAAGRAPTLLHADSGARILVTRYLPGVLVLGHPAQDRPDTYRQAGELLAVLHAQDARTDEDYLEELRRKTLARLERPHRIAPEVVERVRADVAGWPTGPVVVVPTHGDWQPRNWLVDEGTVRLIDFGRADLRPAESDLVRLERQDFWRDPALADAFMAGYGADPRSSPTWQAHLVAEAVGTTVWAYDVGDVDFEEHGHRLLAAALA